MSTIVHSTSIPQTVLALIAEGWNSLVQAGQWPTGVLPVSPSDEVVYAKVGTEPVGFIAWRRDSQGGRIAITMAYVEPTSRRSGVFTELLARLRIIAKESGFTGIDVRVSFDNEVAQEALEKVGGLLTTYDYEVAV